MRLGLSLYRLGKLITNLTVRPTPKTSRKKDLCDMLKAVHVPLIPMQLVMAAPLMRARERLHMLKLPVIMRLQDEPLPQLPNTIHNVAFAPLQAITLVDALLLRSSRMDPLCQTCMRRHASITMHRICTRVCINTAALRSGASTGSHE